MQKIVTQVLNQSHMGTAKVWSTLTHCQ